jgi:hypothetical protein
MRDRQISFSPSYSRPGGNVAEIASAWRFMSVPERFVSLRRVESDFRIPFQCGDLIIRLHTFRHSFTTS